MFKTGLKLLVVLIILAGGAAAYFFYVAGGVGTSPLERWIGNQIKAVAGGYLNVELEFDNPDYQSPKTVILEDIRLTADDPANPGKKIDIMTIGRAELTLGEIPSEGQPLHIEHVILDKPVLRFIATGQGAAGFVGFSNLVKSSGEAKPEEPATGPPPKVTDVFRIRLIQLNDGRIIYDPRQADAKAMDLDQINCKLDVQPDAEGWYALKTTLGRKPVLEVSIDGRMNINDNRLELGALTAGMTLGGQNNKSLPPQLQTFLDEHDVKGDLDITGNGLVNFSDITGSDLKLDVKLDKGSVAFSDYRIDIQSLLINTALANRVLELTKLDLNALDGNLSIAGTMGLTGGYDTALTIRGKDLHVHRVLKAGQSVQGTAATATELPFRGKLQVDAQLRAPLTQLTTQVNGGGRLLLTEARFTNTPVVSDIEDALIAVSKLGDASGKPAPATDQGLVEFTLKGDHLMMDKLDYRSAIIAVRGAGTMHFADTRLNMLLNGGPVEKVQALLGAVGDFTAKITDSIAGYKVTGTTSEPKVELQVGGGVFNELQKLFK